MQKVKLKLNKMNISKEIIRADEINKQDIIGYYQEQYRKECMEEGTKLPQTANAKMIRQVLKLIESIEEINSN